MKKIKTVIAPKGCENYLTAGKEYSVIDFGKSDEEYDYRFYIEDDEKDEIYCLLKNCAHLKGNNWIIKE